MMVLQAAADAATSLVGRFLNDYFNVDPTIADPIGYAVQGILVFILLYIAGRAFVIPLVNRAMDRRGLDTHAKKPLNKVAFFIVVFIAIAIAFSAAGRGNILTSLATIAAAATLAIGFAMQDVLQNFVAGVFIFTEKPFRIGDWIEFDDQSGVVEDISLRVTRLRTFDNELLTVPNSQLTDNVVKNPVDADKLRLKFVFGIGYDDDIEQATDIILEEAEAHDDIMDDPEPSVRLTELGDSSVGLQSRIWISNPSRADFVKTRAEYVRNVKQRFDEEGIDIPYPHRTLTGGLEFADGPVAES
ncbi:mechanosensitive ion channel family protein [Natronomonas amylolytica]|uniref:mechanosensitive ion channel family protein n=1 Tax=Natronomonas amylolytica TaxID=3108498 RepID=UPI0030086735